MGGAVRAIEIGYMQDEIAKASYDFQKAVESGEQIVVGVNKYTEESLAVKQVFRIDDNIRQLQIQKLQSLKNTRSAEAVKKALVELEQAANGKSNCMPFILNAVENYATLGEISDVLRRVFGEFRP